VTPDAYRAYTARLAERMEADARVVGLVALGSMAAIDYQPDAWSDHDFFVVTRAGEQPAMRSDLSWLPDANRLVLGFQETEHGVKALYDDGHMLEFAVFDERELRLAKVNRFRVLVDKDGVAPAMAEVREATVRSVGSDARDDAWLVGMFLTNLLVGAGRHRRGERLSGGQYVRAHALGHLLVLLARHVRADGESMLDDLDPFRRFERVHPALGAELAAILLEEAPEAGKRLLEVAVRELGGRIDLPERATEVVRRALSA
jgi:hypothetical protein